MKNPHHHFIDGLSQDFAITKLKQMAASLGIPLDLLSKPLPSALQDKADAIGDQCCEDLYVISLWWRDRGRSTVG